MTRADDSDVLTEDQAGRILAGMNEVIRAGEEMRKLRTEMIKVFVGLGWTQERIAQVTDVSQPAISKHVRKHQIGDPPRLGLDQRDIPWLEGRLWGLADAISDAVDEDAACARFVYAIGRGRKRFTPATVDELRRLVERDLIGHEAVLPAVFRRAYDEISRGLDLPTKPAGTITESVSVRRALAHEIQRDRLR